MSGAGRRTVKATDHPVAAAAQQPAADKRLPISDCVLLIRLRKQPRNHRRGERNQPVQVMQQPKTRLKMHLQRHGIWLRLLLIMVRGTTIQLHLYPLRENKTAQ